MNISRRMTTLVDLLRGLSGEGGASPHRRDRGHEHEYATYEQPGSSSILQGISARSQEILDVAEEVAAEQQARLGLVSRDRDLCRLVLTYLRQQPLRTATEPITREGTWLLAILPDPAMPNSAATGLHSSDGWNGSSHLPEGDDEEHAAAQDASSAGGWSIAQANGSTDPQWPSPAEIMERLAYAEIDLILYLVDGEDGWREEDAQWFARIRSLGAPVLPVLIVMDNAEDAASSTFSEPPSDQLATLLARLRSQLGIQPCLLTVAEPSDCADELNCPPPGDAPKDVIELTNRILSLRPRLAIPLAQDIPWCRHAIAQRIIRTGALISALVGAEPIPLLDLPIHVALHWKVALQLAAIHGRPGLDFRSREMVGAISINLVMRYCAQQLLKIVPLVGWLLSGLLSGVSTMLLGHALLRYYENDEIWNWTSTKGAWRRQANQTRGRVGVRVRGLGGRLQGVRRGGVIWRSGNSDGDEPGETQTIPIDGGQS